MRSPKQAKSERSDETVLRSLLGKWEAELEEDLRLLTELPLRIEKKKEKIKAIAIALGEPIPNSAAIEAKTRKDEQKKTIAQKATGPRSQKAWEKITWRSEISRVLGKAEKGLTHKDLLEQLVTSTPLGTRRSDGDKGFYNAVVRLIRSGHVVRHGKLLFLKEVALQIEANGGKLPDAPEKAGGSSGLLLDLLQSRPAGLSGPDIQAILSEHPAAPPSIRHHKHYVYNMLAGLIGKGLVSRSEDGIYRAAK